MTLEAAIRLTEILMGFAFVQQSIEHLTVFSNERRLFLARLALAVLLIIGVQTVWISFLLLLLGLAILTIFQGPYNGGADRMGLLVLSCLFLAHLAQGSRWQELAFGYLALQLILSYFISGGVKLLNPEWRNGQALRDVFQFSAYPVSKSLRQLSQSARLLQSMSWAVILFELLFPLALISSGSLTVALIIAAIFHLTNAFLFGLNRFFWIWVAAYPSIIWFQARIF